MKALYIIGAGGFGREVFSWAEHHPDCGKRWAICGFYDDNLEALNRFDYPVGVVGKVSEAEASDACCYVLAIGDSLVRRRIGRELLDAGCELQTLIHPTVTLGRNVQLGRGVLLCPQVTLTCDIELGDGVVMNAHSSIGHDVKVADWCSLMGHCELNGGCVLEEAVYMGTGSRMIPGRRAGAEAFIGAGSVVLQSVPAGARVFGNPARRIR